MLQNRNRFLRALYTHYTASLMPHLTTSMVVEHLFPKNFGETKIYTPTEHRPRCRVSLPSCWELQFTEACSCKWKKTKVLLGRRVLCSRREWVRGLWKVKNINWLYKANS